MIHMQWQKFLLDSDNPLYSFIPLILIFVVTWILSAISSKYGKKQEEEAEAEESSGGSLMDMITRSMNTGEQQESGRRGKWGDRPDQNEWPFDDNGFDGYQAEAYHGDGYDMVAPVPEPSDSDTAFMGYDKVVTSDPIEPKWWGA